MKLGKLPAQPTDSDFRLTAVSSPLPPAPSRFGFGTYYSDWLMLGNDVAGNCVFAGADHETMLYNKWAGKTVNFRAADALADYSTVTGYDVVTGDNDNGTFVKDAMGFRRSTGVRDALGTRHKIDAYVGIDAKDFDLMVRATHAFGCVGIGFDFPDSAWDEFDKGKTWTVHPGSPIDGGHYVPVVGSMDSTKECSVITWGKRQRMSKEFYETYNDEAWVPLSLEATKYTSFGGVKVDVLKGLLAAL